jgi:hypothetical protein
MNSFKLKENGFAEFVPLKGLSFSSLPNNKGSVLVLADTTLAGTNTTDILYIGRTKKPAKRIFGGYLAGCGGKTSKKINSKLLNDGLIEKVAISWMLNDEPKIAQKQLLENFKKEHGEYPAWNASKKKSETPQPSTKATKSRTARKSIAKASS